MVKQWFVVFLICALSNYFIGCHSSETVSVSGSAAKEYASEKILSLVTTTGYRFVFDAKGGEYIVSKKDSSDFIAGRLVDGQWKSIGVDSVLDVHIEREYANVAGTVILILVVGIATAAVIAAASSSDHTSSPPSGGTGHSCPYIYAHDGERFVFDAEPYGGAIAEGLKKTDYCRLEHLKPMNGTYSLLMQNETEETQYTDEMKLLVFDHPPRTIISPDYSGRMTGYRRTIPPIAVTDEHHQDLMKFFQSRDDVRWETRLPADSSQVPTDLRHHLTFTFKKNRNAQTMKFLVNAATAWWGSSMIKNMLDLRGNRVDAWYNDINNHGQEYWKLVYFMEREELYVLKMNVWEEGSWTTRATINGGGPLVAEDRVISLDVSHVKGDSLKIQLNPPLGYWSIDYLGTIDEEVPISQPVELSPSTAEDQQGRDLTTALRAVDSNSYVMPEIGNWAKLGYTVPQQVPGTDRTVYLRTTGYYELHLKKDRPEQTDLMTDIGFHPGRIVSYSLQEYFKWRAGAIGERR
jgi:hypothetical protein